MVNIYPRNIFPKKTQQFAFDLSLLGFPVFQLDCVKSWLIKNSVIPFPGSPPSLFCFQAPKMLPKSIAIQIQNGVSVSMCVFFGRVPNLPEKWGSNEVGPIWEKSTSISFSGEKSTKKHVESSLPTRVSWWCHVLVSVFGVWGKTSWVESCKNLVVL